MPSSCCPLRLQHLLSLDLAALNPGLRDAAVLALLGQLPALLKLDTAFVDELRAVAFVPNAQGQLFCPGQLYDPRNPDLLALLDQTTSFPSEDFCAAPSALAALQQLGLRWSPGPDTLLSAARFVERLGSEADASGNPDDMDMAVARGKALLAYLEVEAGRMVAQTLESPASVTGGMARGLAGFAGGPGALVGRLGLGLLSRMSEALGQGQRQAAGGQPAAGESSADMRRWVNEVVGFTDLI